jgi:MoaD family protein
LIVEVKFYTTLREVTGRETLKLRLKHGATVEQALERLVRRYGQNLARKLSHRENWVVMLNDKNVAFLNGFETILKDGDRLAILSPLSGG